MTEPEHTGNEAEKIVKEAWWHSKALIGTLFAHALTASGAIFGVLLNHQAAGVIIPAQLASHVALQTGHNAANAAIDRAQATSYAYPSNGQYPPQPAPPVTIVQPAGGAVTPIIPVTGAPIAPTPPAGPRPGMNL